MCDLFSDLTERNIQTGGVVRLVIVHGTKGNPDENWFPWLRTQADTAGFETIVPAFPTPGGQDTAAWHDAFRREVGAVSPDLILVGHSLGAVFILRALEEAEAPARAAYLISGFTGALGIEEFDTLNRPFTEGPYDWARIQRRAERFSVWMGDNDPYVPRDQGEGLARHVGVELTLIPKGGHLNTAAGYTEFPLLWEDIRDRYAMLATR